MAAPASVGVASSSSYQPVRIAIGTYSAFISVDTWRTEWPHTIKTLGKDASKYVLLTDANIDRLYARVLRENLQQLGLEVLYLVLPPGEQTKSRETKAMIEDWMFSRNCGRDTVILAFGGGVMGDLCGYVASGYMRGIPFIQLPTSFLAMVDSSIGGKTGIDTPAGKNLLGAFHRPLAVLIDLSLLLTLPQRELCNGMAESIKAGIIWSLPLFELMESNVDGLLKTKDLTLLAQVVERSVQIKAHVVLNDELEAGLRSILNFGHSIGHAIEAFMQPDLLHGECVAIGMIEEIILARGYGLVGSGELRRVDNILKSFALPTRVPPHLSASQLLEKMSIDKKNKNGKKELVLVTAIGKVKSEPRYTTMIPDGDLELLLAPSIGVTRTGLPICGSVSVPGSKSLSNRVLLLAAMGRGPCLITGLLHSQDTQVMIDSLRELGIAFEWVDGLKRLRVHGCEGQLRLPTKSLFLNNAGTASRFLTSLVCLVPNGEIILTGNARMQERPIGDLVDALKRCGNHISYMGTPGCLPLLITGNGSGLRGGIVHLAANISSQYVSSILLSAPYAQGDDLTLKLDVAAGKKVVSKPFIDMTVQLMRQFNIDVQETAPFLYTVKRGAYANPPEFQVEGDASSATYPLTLAAVSGGTVTVANVGSASLQGDAQFCTVLQRMGCTVTQTPTTTTVRGPDYHQGEKLRAIEIDMDAMTDTFMTLAAVAVFAEGTTRITNIANQRVKECNRLAVTVSEMIKCGVQASESETGMDIVGLGLTESALEGAALHVQSHPNARAVIECHDDHRIAMSFAVVGTRIPGIILNEKRCVDKTYPEFWEDLTKIFQVGTYAPKEGIVPLQPPPAKAAPKPTSLYMRESVWLIGMRGSGKSCLGKRLAQHLRRPFVDLDALLEQDVGETCKAYVERMGWPAFRQKEYEILKAAAVRYADGYVVSCGGGVVELPAAIKILQDQRCVIQLRRHIDDVVAYLAADATRPGFDAREVWLRRQPLYADASSYEFIINRGDTDWAGIEGDFCRFAERIVQSRPWAAQSNTFFLSLTLTDLAAFSPEELRGQLATMTRGSDAIEVRVDLVTPTFDDETIKSYLSKVRRASELPIIYTVRSQSQGGKFVDYDDLAGESQFVRQLLLGFRLGCEFVDMEVAIPAMRRQQVFEARAKHYPQTMIIASHHEPKTNGGSIGELKALFDRCLRCGTEQLQPDVVKVVVYAFEDRDALRLVQTAGEFESSSSVPTIALAMGPAGRLSRVANRVLTPVTHRLLPTAAAPGQLSVEQIMRLRDSLGMHPFDAKPPAASKKFYLFGSPITYSQSPLLHNTAFAWCGLAPTFEYVKQDTTSIEDVRATLATSEFGGGNVTIPLKEAACNLVATHSPAVQAIGALNTIVRRADGSLHGENTDWAGIHALFVQKLPHPPTPDQDIALVIGAGGTARAAIYAMQQLGFSNNQIVLFNPRTTEKAYELAKQFGIRAVSTVSRSSLCESTHLSSVCLLAMVSTIPGPVSFRLDSPDLFLLQETKPVVLDATYIPGDTAFLQQCAGEFAVPKSQVVRGLDLLIAQGFFAMEAWIGKTLPAACKHEMETAVRAAYAQQQAATASSSK